MKLPVTQKIVTDVLTESHNDARLVRGAWATLRDGAFCGCAVGNLLRQASGGRLGPFAIDDAALGIMRGKKIADYGADLSNAREMAARGHALAAISCVFEARYLGTTESLAYVLDGIREVLPARFSIDIDGLRALPTWRKKPTKRKAKAVRK